MQKSDITYNEISQEMENFIIHDIINQFMPMKNDESNESKNEDSKNDESMIFCFAKYY